MSQLLQDALSRVRFSDVQWVGFREVRDKASVRHVRDGHPLQNSTFLSHGVMVEVLAGGQFGYAATPSLSPESLDQAVARARAQAVRASPFAIHSFTPSVRPKVTGAYASSVKRPLDSLPAGELNGILVEISNRLKKGEKIVRTEALAITDEIETHFVSSNGSDVRQQFFKVSSHFEATAQDGPVVQKRSSGGHLAHSAQGGWEFFLTDDLWARVDQVGEQALELISAEECPTGATSLVLAPDQMILQIHESIGHPLELDRIIGDERNYAGWSFVRPKDFGSLQYGSRLMNVTFDPTISHQFASYAFDDNGTPATREHLIRDGVLVRALGGLESQLRSGIPGVANSRASSWNRAPIDRMANLNLEPGDSSLDEIISSVERGVWMESNRSWSIDDFRNKFQFGCEYGRLIENGKLTRTVKNPNYRGISVPFWNSLAKVGDRSTFQVLGVGNCGKGEPNQSMWVGHASPVCLFENVEVFGGAQ